MKTENLETIAKITKIVLENPEIESSKIAHKIGLSYDTTARYLKKMTEDKILKRKAFINKKEKKHSWEVTLPWTYQYLINSGATQI